MKIKHSILIFVAVCMFLGGTSFVSAEQEFTPVLPSGNVSDISGMTLVQLQELVAKLQKELILKKGNGSPVASTKNTELSVSVTNKPIVAKKYLEIRSEVAKGGSGDDVRLLQRVLASDPSVYPEGIATGFFGDLTGKAISRFQTKFGLKVTGTMTPETRELINKILESEGATSDIPQFLLSKPGLKDRIKMEWRFNNGILERVIRVDSKKDSLSNEDLKIEIETKFKTSKVKVEYKDKKSTYLFGTTNTEDIIKKLAIKLGLSEDVVKSAINSDLDEDISGVNEDDSQDESSDDSNDDNEDGGSNDSGGDDN